MSSLPPLVGHEELQERLAGAVRRGRLPASLLFHGPAGVGKQRLALWLAAVLQCESQSGCGRCRGCRLAARLEHPDIHWFFPLPRPSGSHSASRLREKLEEARHEALAERREEPLRPVDEDASTGIYLAAVRELRQKAVRRPAMGPRTVFVVGDAETMVPQAANPEAANAFLKVLEEPPEDTHVLVTSSRPGALLPTIRSRVLSVRVPPISDASVVADFLVEHAGAGPGEARAAARASRGSIGRALRLLSEPETERRDRAADLLAVARGGDRGRILAAAARFGPAGARGEFSDLLEVMEELLRDLLGASEGRADVVFDPDRARGLLGEGPLPTGIGLEAIAAVDEARGLARRNVNPQAIIVVLLLRLSKLLGERRA